MVNMKDCKLIVTDLDGTLLRNDKSISKFTIETLNECRRQGILVAFATGRPVRGVEAIKNVFEPDILINHNGAVFNQGDHQVSLGISAVQLREMLAEIFSAFPNTEVGIESGDIFYANYDVTKNWPEEDEPCRVDDFSELEIPYADKVLINLNDNIEEIRSCLSNECYLEIADGTIGMIMSKEATKFNAIATICDVLEIRPTEAICFGDDDNDISMIQGCGIGVAMNNANGRVKEVADALCLSNEEDGVATWIREFVLDEM